MPFKTIMTYFLGFLGHKKTRYIWQKCPRQVGGVDCGVFTLMFVHHIIKSSDIAYKLHMDIMERRERDKSCMIVSKREIIFKDEMTKNQLTVAAVTSWRNYFFFLILDVPRLKSSYNLYLKNYLFKMFIKRKCTDLILPE